MKPAYSVCRGWLVLQNLGFGCVVVYRVRSLTLATMWKFPLSQSSQTLCHYRNVKYMGNQNLKICQLAGRLSLQLSYFGVVTKRQTLSNGPDKP
jgi:hypothetical protein